MRIVAKFELKKGQKITVALGQQGNDDYCGSGGSFVVLQSDKGPEPLLVAGGAGSAANDVEFGRGNLKQDAVGNEDIGSSGKQQFLQKKRKMFIVLERDIMRRHECRMWQLNVFRRNRTKKD